MILILFVLYSGLSFKVPPAAAAVVLLASTKLSIFENNDKTIRSEKQREKKITPYTRWVRRRPTSANIVRQLNRACARAYTRLAMTKMRTNNGARRRVDTVKMSQSDGPGLATTGEWRAGAAEWWEAPPPPHRHRGDVRPVTESADQIKTAPRARMFRRHRQSTGIIFVWRGAHVVAQSSSLFVFVPVPRQLRARWVYTENDETCSISISNDRGRHDAIFKALMKMPLTIKITICAFFAYITNKSQCITVLYVFSPTF